MRRSTDRIRIMHAGSLPRPADLRAMLNDKATGKDVDAQAFESRVASAVEEVVQKQIESGMDSVNDGELSKPNFTNYARTRLSGFEIRAMDANAKLPQDISARDQQKFPGYFENRQGAFRRGPQLTQVVCNGRISYIGQRETQADINRFKSVLAKVDADIEPYLPAVAPGTIEHWLRNDYYPTDEAYLAAIADAMHQEYKAITDAGFVLQIDDPDLPDAWNIYTEMTVPEYRSFAQLRIDALNHALRDIPQEQIRLHVCWGSYHGPHNFDIPLRDIVDLILSVKAETYSIEAANPCHEHEWEVWKDVKLPDGKTLIPGVVGHCTDFIEHPTLIEQRLLRYADLVGKENLQAGTDCGLGERVGHAEIVWAKFAAMRQGADQASAKLWG
jgi:5-methyltetrahydropteroyltriglutamate--homocysteine methyltransferase